RLLFLLAMMQGLSILGWGATRLLLLSYLGALGVLGGYPLSHRLCSHEGSILLLLATVFLFQLSIFYHRDHRAHRDSYFSSL
ncbi:MAG: hypothetical protein KBC64_06610, partial [Simkaniaceae bacterium]|nr:hypothetical protein [Simkaniaceae bacterium]